MLHESTCVRLGPRVVGRARKLDENRRRSGFGTPSPAAGEGGDPQAHAMA